MVKISEAQKKAIEHINGPMLVLAGPGSGKTFTITKRIEYLITKAGVPADNILVITFTKAAATEMQERFMRNAAQEQINVKGRVNFGTFHAVFFKILKFAYNYNASNIITEEEKYELMKQIILLLQIEIDDERDFIEGIFTEISKIKTERINPDTYYSMNCPEEVFKSIYKAYDGKLKSMRKIDFDDMLVICYELLTARPDILAQWQQKYQYILIDEFQDINQIQYDIVKLLAKPQDNIFIVGDDDQSIYGFRGAKPDIMMNFKKDYKDAEEVLLDINFRSKANIVESALKVVGNNKTRFSKAIHPIKEAGAEVVIREFPEQAEECDQIVQDVKNYIKKGIPYQEIAVLYRTNTQARVLTEKFMEYNIPFRIKDSIPNIYEHWITKNILAYIKLALGSRDRGLFLSIMNRPKRYISRDVCDTEKVDFERIKAYYSDKEWMIDRIERLEYDLSILAKLNPLAAINYIRRSIGYDEYLTEYAEYRRMKPEELFETLAELQETSRGFSTFDEWFEHMDEYAKEIEKQRNAKKDSNIAAVVISTMHSAKGLEYEAVILPDANEGLIPYRRAIMPAHIEEERRMFYVAMTRAKQYLSIYYLKKIHGKDEPPSRFIDELRDTAHK